MRIGIIGAGISGLAAARTLRSLGNDVVIFEELNQVGGRIATEQLAPYIFDTGTTSFVPRGKSLENVMLHELNTAELIQVELPIYIHSFGRVSTGDLLKNADARYTYLSGNILLPKMLADGLQIRFQTRVEQLQRLPGNRYEVMDEEFDGVIVTLPIPYTRQLLATIGETRAFNNVRYRACISVMLGYDKPIGHLPYHALVDPEHRHPITWLSIESLKCPRRAPEGHTAMVAQLGPAYSVDHLDSTDEKILNETLAYIGRLYGNNFSNPIKYGMKRWQYSQPEITAQFENVNPPYKRVLIAGDSVIGGRTELAYESGIIAAKQLYQNISDGGRPPVNLRVV